MIKSKNAVAKEAMNVLRDLYTNNGKEDIVRKELLDRLTKESADIFLTENRTYSSAAFEIAVDYSDGVESGYIPGLCYHEEVADFYNRNKDVILQKAEAFCEKHQMAFDEIHDSVANDPEIKKEWTKIKVATFVINNEAMELKNDIMKYRDKLEQISKEKHVSLKVKKNASLSLDKEARAM